MKLMRITAALLAGIAVVPAMAEAPGSRETREFVQAAGEADMFEIMEAHTAIAESRDPQVLAFARQMLNDHGATSQALRAATARAGIEPPPTIVGAGQSPFLGALQSARGAEFDKAYWRQQALAHRSALVTQQRYAATGDTPAIRQAAAAAVPMIQAHLAMAEQMSAATDRN